MGTIQEDLTEPTKDVIDGATFIERDDGVVLVDKLHDDFDELNLSETIEAEAASGAGSSSIISTGSTSVGNGCEAGSSSSSNTSAASGDGDVNGDDFNGSTTGSLDDGGHGDADKICKAEPLEDALLGDPDNCAICGGMLVVPRMLHCLHVFCESCLDKKLVGESGDSVSPDTSIVCPTCNYVTKVGIKGLSMLPLDVTKTNVSDVSNSQVLHCTSCTTKEIAKSKCSTCHNLLCTNCDTAHHFMRCFESHKVIPLDDMRKDGSKIIIHKPLECDFHNGENIIYYCNTCNVTACAECAKQEHTGHQCEGILDSEIRVRQEMEALLIKSKERCEQLLKSSSGLNNSLEELAHQRSTAKDLINESYQSYKAVLEKCRDDALEELNRLYRERELKIMKENDEVGKSIDNFEDACKFASRLLESGTVQEMMYLRKVVGSRLAQLNNNIPKLENEFNIEFRSDFERFQKMIRENFGSFKTEATVAAANTTVMKATSSPVPMVPKLSPLQINGSAMMNSANVNTNGCGSNSGSNVSVTNGSPISLTTSMQSSFEGEMPNMQNFSMAQSPPIPPAAVNAAATPALQGFSSMAEYNIAQLATLAKSSSTEASPTPQFNLEDILTNDTAIKNLASLVKLGLHNDNSLPNGGSGMLVRSTSNASLTNNLINGFNGVPTSPSPLISTPDDIIADPMSAILPPAAANNPPATIARTNKVSPMQIRVKFGQLGPSKGQFNSPHGFCLGLDEDIIVADTNNHRIQVFDKAGIFKIQFGIPGKDEGQLWYPRKVAVMRNTGKYVVCDRGNERSRMQIFTKNGHFLKKIAIRYIDIVAGLAVTSHGEIVAVDSVSPTVFIIGENGELLRWFDCSDYMREPSDIAIHGREFYVCDFKGHNVVVFSEDGHFLRRIGCESLTNFPNGIDVSDAGDVLIGDSHGNRFHVAVFSRDGSLIAEFECPYVKVSRCCGLKITSEGYVVTLAKNNHHVLVLNTLYIL